MKIIKYLVMIITICSCLIINVDAEITVDTNKKGSIDIDSSYVTSKGNLTITGVTSDEKFTAYKILDTYYNETSNTLTYEFTDNFKTFLENSTNYKNLTVNDYSNLTSGDITNGQVETLSTLDKLVSLYTSYIKNNNVVGVEMITNDTNSSASVEVGSYLIIPTQTNRVYAVMVGNLEYSYNESSEWTLNDVNIVAKTSEVDIKVGIDDIDSNSKSFNKDEEFSYYITSNISKYPTNATNKKYEIKTTFDNGITFKGIEFIEFSDGDELLTIDESGNIYNKSNNKVATASFSNSVLTIDCDVDYISSNIISIIYKAKLNDEAVSKNINTTTLTYSNNPYGSGTITTDSKETIANTYGIKLFVHEKNESLGLENSTFELYTDTNLTTKIATITTDSSGNGEVFGLKLGNYYLKATKAPSGYNLLTDVIIVNLDSNDTSEDKIFTTVDVAVPKRGLLPSTGNWKTILMIIIGLVVIIGSIYSYKKYQKKYD